MQKLFNASILILGILAHMQQLHCNEQPADVHQASSIQHPQDRRNIVTDQKLKTSSRLNKIPKKRVRKKRRRPFKKNDIGTIAKTVGIVAGVAVGLAVLGYAAFGVVWVAQLLGIGS